MADPKPARKRVTKSAPKKAPAKRSAAPKKAPQKSAGAKRPVAPPAKAERVEVEYTSTVLKAAMSTIQALRDLDALKPQHDGLVIGLFKLAEQLDAKPGSDALWREYRLMLAQLREVGDGVGGDDDEALDAVEVAVPSKVGNTRKR